MSAFTEYNAFVNAHKQECCDAGISPRQAAILAAAMLQWRKGDNGGRVSFILMMPDRSTLDNSDAELLNLMIGNEQYLTWGDSELSSFAITPEGITFIQEHPHIFHDLIPDIS